MPRSIPSTYISKLFGLLIAKTPGVTGTIFSPFVKVKILGPNITWSVSGRARIQAQFCFS